MSASVAEVASPCVGVCRLDRHARICVGCGRSGEEIADWRDLSNDERARVVASLTERLATFDTLHVPSKQSAAQIGDFVARGLRQQGVFVIGCFGAVGEFFAPSGEKVVVSHRPDRVEAAAIGGRFRLTIAPDLVLLKAPRAAATPTVVAAPRELLPPACGLVPIGPDSDPIGPQNGAHRDTVLFDLGLGVAGMRFMVRTADPVLIARLDALAGASLTTVLSDAGAMLIEASPTRVVESPLARIEVDTKIPPPGVSTPEAPHTHLMPGPLAIGRALPPGVGCPAGLVPIALHYPSSAKAAPLSTTQTAAKRGE